MTKKIFFTLFLAFISVFGQSQSNQFGSLNLGVGGGLGIYKTNSEFNATFGSLVITDRDTSAAATTYFNFSADFGVMKLLSVGLFVQSGKYVQEEESGITKDNSFTKFGIMPKLYIVNKDKFNLYAGLGLGVVNLKTMEKNNNSNTTTEAKYSGSNFHLRLGMNYYFTNAIGMYFHAGYDGNNFNLKELTVKSGSTSNTPTNLTGKLNASGAELAVGLNIKFLAGN